jgi:hypothetical protein
MNRLQRVCCYAAAAGLACLVAATPEQAAAVSYWEDFESGAANALPSSTGLILEWYGDNDNRSGTLWRTAQDGALFDDPIGADGNKSAVLDNNNHGFSQTFPENDGPTNATMGQVWSTQPGLNKSGTIAFDFYLSPTPDDGFTYVDVRLGHRTDGANFVSTGAPDTFGWFSLRVDRDADTGLDVPKITSNSIPGVGDASVAPLIGETNHVSIEIDNGFHTYTLNGAVIEWDVNGNPVSTLPALPGSGALGVSGMTFVGNFEGAPGTPKGLVYIDNLHVELVPEPTTALLTVLGGFVLLAGRRRT